MTNQGVNFHLPPGGEILSALLRQSVPAGIPEVSDIEVTATTGVSRLQPPRAYRRLPPDSAPTEQIGRPGA